MSSIITISQPPSNPGDKSASDNPTEMTFAPIDPDSHPEDLDLDADFETLSAKDDEGSEAVLVEKELAREGSMDKLLSAGSKVTEKVAGEKSSDAKQTPATVTGKAAPTSKPPPLSLRSSRRQKSTGPDAVIVLKEERASTFLDFLRFVYPQ